mgnify:CR=1 FL=1
MKFPYITGRTHTRQELPLVPLGELIVFPHMVVPFLVTKQGTIKAVEHAMGADRRLFLGYVKDDQTEIEEADLNKVGTIATVLQMLKLPDGSLRLLVEGSERGEVVKYLKRIPPLRVQVRPLSAPAENGPAAAAHIRTVREAFRRHAELNKKLPPDTIKLVEKSEDPGKIVDLIAAALPFSTEKKLELLTLTDSQERLERLSVMIEAENEILALQQGIQTRVRKRLEKNQREYFLNEQLKEINRELGYEEGDDPAGTRELSERLKTRSLPPEVEEKTNRELKRLSRLQPMSPEAGVLRTYIEWIADLPWGKKEESELDIDRAAQILDEDHFDMKQAKERILDFIAVRTLSGTSRGPILCLVGPPGTGKTSLGQSVARALGRTFVRISLGGVHDEAEIRGHRKTYVGAFPGRIIQSLKRAGTSNPVFLLDEIDKMTADFRGDPASALLEVLDPEQNSTFVDHYIEVPFDLSDVMFITTANSVHKIPYALRDRMEIIEIPGYTEFEKLSIAEKFLVPKQIRENGLDWAEISFQNDVLLEIIRNYTLESGVRSLERQIAQVIRKIAREAVREGRGNRDDGDTPKFSVLINDEKMRSALGPPKFQKEPLHTETRPGLAYGLAWTEVGGRLLPVEVSVFEGRGDLILTGSLGGVMRESARTALSFIRAHSHRFNLPANFAYGRDIHIHVPEGAIPKDGPSAGITLTAAMLSSLSGVPIKEGYAMTGEITLTGRILAIGGLKEKVLAAHRHRMLNVIVPDENRRDTEDFPEEVLSSVRLIFVHSAMEALGEMFPSELFRPGRGLPV